MLAAASSTEANPGPLQVAARAAPTANAPSASVTTAGGLRQAAPATTADAALTTGPGPGATVVALQDASADPGGSGLGDGDADDDSGDDTGNSDDTAASAFAGFTPLAFAPATGIETQTTGGSLSASAADLAAQVAAKVSGGASEFKIQLNPLGLGQVDVTVSIGADRQLTAALAFSDPQTASALSAHAGELKSALEQAGFSVPSNGFDFTTTATATVASGLQSSSFGLGGGSGFGGGFTNQGDNGRSASAAFSAGEALAGGGPGAGASGAWAATADSRLDIRI